MPSPDGRSRLWTRIVHGADVHQTTCYTAEDRYPELFDQVAQVAPESRRILSFGCSSGEELVAIRRRFVDAEIVGAEINPRLRRRAARRTASDVKMHVMCPRQVRGEFDLIFALAVLQRQPHRVAETGMADLSAVYPFAKFDLAVSRLVDWLRRDGILCITNAHYRVEDTQVAGGLRLLASSEAAVDPIFGPQGRRITPTKVGTIFRKNAIRR